MTDNKYHGVICPTCRKQVVIRLRQDEPYTGRCQCPHRTVTVVWVDDKPTLQAQEGTK